MTTDQNQTATVLTPQELSVIVLMMREARKWSQEVLAEISGVSVRSIQRMEKGEASSPDNRRAVAHAFGAEDIDAFNKPFVRKTADELKAEQAKFDEENITLKVHLLKTGEELARLAQTTTMDLTHSAFEMTEDMTTSFAFLKDYFREYRDAWMDFTETERLPIYKELQGHIDDLKRLGVSLVYSTRMVELKKAVSDAPGMGLCYLVAFPKGKEPSEMVASREVEYPGGILVPSISK